MNALHALALGLPVRFKQRVRNNPATQVVLSATALHMALVRVYVYWWRR
jgi:hypothetical protein